MKDQIKSYLQRLNHGEALENVQADFVRECKDVDPSAIMQAEQELLREGTSIEELQRLCDVHSALFHGSTTEEKIANAEKTAAPSLAAQELHSKDIKDQRLSAAAALIQISGHPLQTFTLENALNSHPSFPFCKRVSHFESDLQILYPTFHFCNDFPVFSLAFMI